MKTVLIKCALPTIASFVLLAGGVNAEEVKIKAENVAALKGSKKVILGNFVVEFQKRYEKTNTGFSLLGFGNAGSSTAVNDVSLPDQGTLQTITNFAYLDTLKKLRDSGYEVVEITGLSAASKPSYDKLIQGAPIKSGVAFDNVDGDSILVSPEGMSSVFPLQGCGHYEPEKKASKLFAGLGAAGLAFSTNTNAMLENEIANAEGKVPVLKVWITVGFGDVEAKGGNAFISERQKTYAGTTTTVSNSANAKATGGMYLKPAATRFSLTVADDNKYHRTYKQNCATKWGKLDKSVPPPADGDVLIQLTDKYHDDGAEVLSLQSQAGTVGVTEKYLGGGIGLTTVKENNDGTSGQSTGDAQGVQVSEVGSRTTGTVSTSGMGTSLNTTQQYVTRIRSDFYATTAVKMASDVVDIFIKKMQ